MTDQPVQTTIKRRLNCGSLKNFRVLVFFGAQSWESGHSLQTMLMSRTDSRSNLKILSSINLTKSLTWTGIEMDSKIKYRTGFAEFISLNFWTFHLIPRDSRENFEENSQFENLKTSHLLFPSSFFV